MEKVLRLGRVDEDIKFSEAEKQEFLRLYHHPQGFSGGELRFRDDSRNRWWEWEKIEGHRIRDLTRLLQEAGFMPHAEHGGIFGYATQAAVRLFQEYVRTIDSPERHQRRDPPSWPDGVVGDDTQYYLDQWADAGRRCRWSNGETRPDYVRWMTWLQAAKAHHLAHPTPALRALAQADRRGDTFLPEEWDFGGTAPHLIGIRRQAGAPAQSTSRRAPDDLFVLLVQGMTFYFWGSTDANPSSRREGYLMEGQHRYRFNWHNIGEARRDRIYKAGRPAGAGVMVIRDVHGDNALTDRNRQDGFDPIPNPTFNIHWSGLGISNWSAGCQVISGKNYINDRGDLVNCVEYAARNDSERGTKRGSDGPRLTMGAYTVLSDLMLCYTPAQAPGEKPTFRYSLFRKEDFAQIPGIPADELKEKLHLMRSEQFF
ncbi:peptidoglycan-binding domain-containing protein [Neolewinella litorea]|uniref:Peptidoglycan-binding protein n=1 Tax=Neolewinella litorea TaxID=2562452 RepID=A0A4S4NQ41_9BACT|nr:peptidoglycan-binding protein [Neolewinella litorea]THH41247.1 peptidoglycan-binding protein [Neolewinella litorea]